MTALQKYMKGFLKRFRTLDIIKQYGRKRYAKHLKMNDLNEELFKSSEDLISKYFLET